MRIRDSSLVAEALAEVRGGHLELELLVPFRVERLLQMLRLKRLVAWPRNPSILMKALCMNSTS